VNTQCPSTAESRITLESTDEDQAEEPVITWKTAKEKECWELYQVGKLSFEAYGGGPIRNGDMIVGN